MLLQRLHVVLLADLSKPLVDRVSIDADPRACVGLTTEQLKNQLLSHLIEPFVDDVDSIGLLMRTL